MMMMVVVVMIIEARHSYIGIHCDCERMSRSLPPLPKWKQPSVGVSAGKVVD